MVTIQLMVGENVDHGINLRRDKIQSTDEIIVFVEIQVENILPRGVSGKEEFQERN